MILASSKATLARLMRLGGIVPELRAERLKTIARMVSQNHAWPRAPLMPRYSPNRLPNTTTASASSSTTTPARCPRGSAPPTSGAGSSPPATQAVATQKIASCRCHVRASV